MLTVFTKSTHHKTRHSPSFAVVTSLGCAVYSALVKLLLHRPTGANKEVLKIAFFELPMCDAQQCLVTQYGTVLLRVLSGP